MVNKTTYRGVHSGNTLRAFKSRYRRQYYSQACIVSTARPELLKRLTGDGNNVDGKTLGSVADDSGAGAVKSLNSNVAVDVALSLNKRARWLLPSTLIRQIDTDDIADPELTVSLLERHKLRRSVNCVSFHSNKGEVKRIQLRSGRYFQFRFPLSGEGKSRRALRRQRREELREHVRSTAKASVGRTVDVYTKSGTAVQRIGESEVQYEVFYPSPAESSISHNPKYIKHRDDVQQRKPKRQHRGKQRKKMTLKDVDQHLLPSHHWNPQPTSLVADDVSSDDEADPVASGGSVAERENTGYYLLGSLIEKAERLQRVVAATAEPRPRKKSGGRDKAGPHHQAGKPHVVFLHRDPAGGTVEVEASSRPHVAAVFDPPAATEPRESARVLLPSDDVTVTALEDRFRESYIEAACVPRKFVLDVTANVRELLKKRGVLPKVASAAEDALSYLVFIRDGIYDETHDVYKVLLNSRLRRGLVGVSAASADEQGLVRTTVLCQISHAVGLMDGFVTDLLQQNHFPDYHSGTDSLPNRQLKQHLASAEAYLPSVQRVFRQGPTPCDDTFPSLSDLLTEEPAFCDVCYDDVSALTWDSTAATALSKCRHKVCDSCWGQHIHSRLAQGFVRVTCPGFDCQEDVKVGVLLSVVPVDTVEKVLHRQEAVRVGASATEKWCPGQSCERVIRLHASPSCAETSQTLQQDVLCTCGAHVCFNCLSPAHWPASCAQAENYRNSLTARDQARARDKESEAKREQRQAKEKKETMTVLMVEGKHCPRCKNFVCKDGGCAQMMCMCGQLFCWFCAKPGLAHYDRVGCVDERKEKKRTTTLVVRHLSPEDTSGEARQPPKTSSVSSTRRLMDRAAEHRQRRLDNQGRRKRHEKAIVALITAIVKAASKDANIARRVISACSGLAAAEAVCTKAPPALLPVNVASRAASSSTPSTAASWEASRTDSAAGVADTMESATPETLLMESSSLQADSRERLQMKIVEEATAFLHRAILSSLEVYEVTEYSLVLLKDLPGSALRQRALRICEDLAAFSSFTQSIFDAWEGSVAGQGSYQEGVKAIMRLAEIHGWTNSALTYHVRTIRKIRRAASDKQ